MADFLLLIPTGPNVGLTTVSIGLVRAFEREGIRVGFAKPIAQRRTGAIGDASERSTEIVRASTHLNPPEPLTREHVERAMREGDEQRLLEEVVARVTPLRESADVVVVEGLVPTEEMPFAVQLNASLGRALDADFIVVGAPTRGGPDALVQSAQLAASGYARD